MVCKYTVFLILFFIFFKYPRSELHFFIRYMDDIECVFVIRLSEKII